MIHLDDLLLSTRGRVYGPVFGRNFTDFCYDSRLLRPGELFVAFVTDKGDGHDYIPEVARAGAVGVLCQRPFDLTSDGVTCIVVENTHEALLAWARFILQKLGPSVVGVTGSSGKTTTKELVSSVLSRRYTVFRNHGNYNNHYGLPIALGKLEPEHEVAVLELACDGIDQIRELAALTRPQIGVVTSINETHLVYMGTIETIAAEKGKLIEALPAADQGGVAILNYDDHRVRAMASRTPARVITYGLNPDADLVAGAVEADSQGTSFTVYIRDFFPVSVLQGERKLRVRLHLLGRHNVYAALASIAVGLALDVPLEEALGALAVAKTLPGRLNLLAGLNGSRILDDSYSASLASTLMALDTLALFSEGQRVAVLGDLLDLGHIETEAYRQVGKRVAHVVDFFVAQGDVAQHIAEQSLVAGLLPEQVLISYTSKDTIRDLSSRLGAGDTVLIKGAAESRMEETVKGLLADPTQASGLLARQTAGWRKVRLLRPGRPTWLEVDLDAIAYNVRRVIEMIGPEVTLLAVLKADAYGHGMIRVAQTALNNGAGYLGIASVNEGIILRQAGITAPTLVLGYVPAWQARELIVNDLSATVFNLDVAKALSQAARELNRHVRIHVKVDTGMGRLGLLPDDVVPFILELQALPRLQLEGIFTHFSVADCDATYTNWQLDRFRRLIQALTEAGAKFSLIHAANSAAILTLPESHFNMVRLGIAMYGLHPSPTVHCPSDFRMALTFKTQIAQVKSLPQGSYVSYGNTYQTVREQTIAVIPVGYADGFRRTPNHWGEVLVKGNRAPIVGRVCMDQTMIDVTSIPNVRQGDEVVLIGEQGNHKITAEDVAEKLGTINYEVVSEILARVPRLI